MKKFITIYLIILFSISTAYANTEKLFYITPDVGDYSFSNDLLEQIKSHAKTIDIIAPQIYQLDENGVIWGSIDSRLQTIAKDNHLKIMPLIINPGFNQEQFHSFLNNLSAQERAIEGMVSLCKQYNLYGLQFDFENIHIKDKNAFTRFFQLTANRLHQNGFAISIAVIPRVSDLLNTDYDRWFFENWSGAFDYQALGQSSDFISVMSYDRHTSLTTPGPIAPFDWVEKTIQSLLKTVPPQKLSLGIPDYSGYWVSGRLNPGNMLEKYTYRSKETQISYAKVLSLINQFNLSLTWQNQWKSSFSMFTNHDRIEFIFVEDAKSFQARFELAKRYQLRGISVWKLGLEDPAIWSTKF